MTSLPGSLSPRATLSEQPSLCSEVEAEPSGEPLSCSAGFVDDFGVSCAKGRPAGAGNASVAPTPRAFFPSDPAAYLGAAATGSEWDDEAAAVSYGGDADYDWEQAEAGDNCGDDDEDDEGPGSFGYCTNCTAPLWSDVCPDCGYALGLTPALFDPGHGPDSCSGMTLAEAVAHRAVCPATSTPPVVVAYDEAMLLHEEPGPPSSGVHPERPDRIRAAWARLCSSQLTGRCVRLPSRAATDEELERVHSRALVSGIQDLSSWHAARAKQAGAGAEKGGLGEGPSGASSDGSSGALDLSQARDTTAESHDNAADVDAATAPPPVTPSPPMRLPSDTYACAATAAAARLGAGAAADVASAVARGEARAGMAIVRPPGHHAESGSAQGFCFFNNAAVAARAAQAAGAARVLVLDWDVHHGNGTQEVFWRDGSVLYVSLHRHEGGSFYPGTGAAREVGEGPGLGSTVNIAWPCSGLTDAEYEAAAATIILPIAAEFAPDLIVLSAGFDAAAGDPIGGCHLTPGLYARLTRLMASVAPCAAVLEGGYNLAAVAACTEACVRALMGEHSCAGGGLVPGMGVAAGANVPGFGGFGEASTAMPTLPGSAKLSLGRCDHDNRHFNDTRSIPTWHPATPAVQRHKARVVRHEIWRAIAETAAAHAPYWACMAGLDAVLLRGAVGCGLGEQISAHAWGRRPASCPPSVCCRADSLSEGDVTSSDDEYGSEAKGASCGDAADDAVHWTGRRGPRPGPTPIALSATLDGALTPALDADVAATTPWADSCVTDDGGDSPPTKRARGVLTPGPFASASGLSLRL